MDKTIDIKEELDKGNNVRIGKNQVFKDGGVYMVETFEYEDQDGVPMYSVQDGYKTVEEAIRNATLV
jgi:hypothetical protein